MKLIVKALLWAIFFNAGARLAHLEVTWSLIIFVVAMDVIDDILQYALLRR